MKESYLIIGPMWSRKTTRLIQLVDLQLLRNRRCLIIIHSDDNRYTCGNKLSTHENVSYGINNIVSSTDKINIVKTISLDNIPQGELLISDSIFIDEGHFFPNICEFFLKYHKDKNIFISALNADYLSNPFPKISKLSIWVNNLERVSGVCSSCENESRLTKKNINLEDILLDNNKNNKNNKNNNTIEVGGKEKYQPVCVSCYFS